VLAEEPRNFRGTEELHQLGVAMAFQRFVAAEQADQQSEAAEADHAGGAAGGCLAYAKDEKALEKVQHEKSSNHLSIVQPEGQLEGCLNY
jgi:tRNA G37 N-methylase TrmD